MQINSIFTLNYSWVLNNSLSWFIILVTRLYYLIALQFVLIQFRPSFSFCNIFCCEIICLLLFWFKYDLGQKYYAPQVRPDWGLNSWPPDHDSTFHVTETSTWLSQGCYFMKYSTLLLNHNPSRDECVNCDYYWHQGDCVFTGVCLYVCLLVTSLKSYSWML